MDKSLYVKGGDVMTPIEKLIAAAEREVGYCEKSKASVTSDPSILDDKTKGAGDGNMTKYSRDLVKWVGSPYAQGVAWCDIFLDWLMISVFGKENAKKLLGGWSAYTPTSASYYKNMNRWVTTPQPGDQIFFKNSVRISHTGLVYKVDDYNVYTIEGNTTSIAGVVENGGCVAKKVYTLTNTRIAGYGRPDYSLIVTAPPIFQNIYPQKGVDVAAWQKGIDYQQMRNAGIKFAVLKIIRKDLQPDEMFEKHYRGFTDAGIPIRCVYNYSYATTVEKAKIDAKRVLGILDGRKIPVALDVEDNCQKELGVRLIQIINAYQDVIRTAGLPFCVYTGLNFYRNYIFPYIGQLDNSNFWIARYPSNSGIIFSDNPDPSKKPDVEGIIAWQYTSKGNIPGVYNGNLDFDILYCPIVEQGKKLPKGMCTANSLRIRNAPNTTGKILGYLKKGEIITIYGKDTHSGWYLINEGQQKWVSNAYIELL